MTTTQDRRRSFQQAIAADPNDPTARLVYADWLEEHGHAAEAQRQRFRVRLAADPYDPTVRSGYAAWLRDRGKDQAAKVQDWVARVLRGETRSDFVFTRRGILPPASSEWDDLRAATRTYWLKATRPYFDRFTALEFIVVTDLPPTRCGFRRERGSRRANHGRSPILWWERGRGCKARVLVR